MCHWCSPRYEDPERQSGIHRARHLHFRRNPSTRPHGRPENKLQCKYWLPKNHSAIASFPRYRRNNAGSECRCGQRLECSIGGLRRPGSRRMMAPIQITASPRIGLSRPYPPKERMHGRAVPRTNRKEPESYTVGEAEREVPVPISLHAVS
jgi:hypothetical protein